MSSSQDVTTNPVSNSVSVERIVGRVKWFNSRAGYGFITVTDGAHSGSDIFVHHSSINVSNEQYKYLVQGEYVEFSLSKIENSTHEYQAVLVGGINSGKLMCETRRDTRLARSNYRNTSTDQNNETLSTNLVSENRADSGRTRRPNRNRRTRDSSREENRQSSPSENKEWTVVTNARSARNADQQVRPNSRQQSEGEAPRPRRGRPRRQNTQPTNTN